MEYRTIKEYVPWKGVTCGSKMFAIKETSITHSRGARPAAAREEETEGARYEVHHEPASIDTVRPTATSRIYLVLTSGALADAIQPVDSDKELKR